MNIDNISKIVGIVVSIATIINAISKGERNNKLIERYFDEVLSVYVKERKENVGIDPVIFIRERFDINDYFIPSYIFYLVDKFDEERLHKVLMNDYRVNFPNKRNLINSGIVSMLLIILMIAINVYLAVAILSFLSAVLMYLLSVIDIIFSTGMNSSKDLIYATCLLIFSGIIGVAYVYFAYDFTTDDYTLMNNQMEKKINKKVKYFNQESIVYNFFNRGDDYYIN